MLRESKPLDSGGFCVGWGHESVVRGRSPAPMRRVPAEEDDCAGLFNSDERMLAGGGCVVGRLYFGEAAVVEGDRLLGVCPPAGRPLPGGNRHR